MVYICTAFLSHYPLLWQWIYERPFPIPSVFARTLKYPNCNDSCSQGKIMWAYTPLTLSLFCNLIAYGFFSFSWFWPSWPLWNISFIIQMQVLEVLSVRKDKVTVFLYSRVTRILLGLCFNDYSSLWWIKTTLLASCKHLETVCAHLWIEMM